MHSVEVKDAIENYAPSKVLETMSPKISENEKTLPRGSRRQLGHQLPKKKDPIDTRNAPEEPSGSRQVSGPPDLRKPRRLWQTTTTTKIVWA